MSPRLSGGFFRMSIHFRDRLRGAFKGPTLECEILSAGIDGGQRCWR